MSILSWFKREKKPHNCVAPGTLVEEDFQDFIEYMRKHSTVQMSNLNADAHMSCAQEPLPLPKQETAPVIDATALDAMMTQIKTVLGPMVAANNDIGYFVENDLYVVTLMKSGVVKIITK